MSDNIKNIMKNYWWYRGEAYDLTQFIKKHPGGSMYLNLTQGKDITHLFETYHVLKDKVKVMKYLKSMKVAHMSGQGARVSMPNYPVPDPIGDLFYRDVIQMARIVTDNNYKIPTSYILVYFISGIIYAFLFKLWLQGIWWSPFPLAMICWIFSVGTSHDASHFAISNNPIINRICMWTAVPFIYNPVLWIYQHTISHHPFTNHPDYDWDMRISYPLVRYSISSKWLSIMKKSWIAQLYIFFVATLYLSIGRVLERLITRKKLRADFDLWIPFLLSVLTLLSPWFMDNRPGFWLKLIHAILPFVLISIVFIIVTSATHMHYDCQNSALTESETWSTKMVSTSWDYMVDSKWCNFLTGGLNCQSLHHLLPMVHSSRLTEMYPRYRELCKKYKIQHHESTSIWHAQMDKLAYIHKINSSPVTVSTYFHGQT
jgi:fatty acid desaturase